MDTLKDIIKKAEQDKVAVGHFNISDLAGLKAIFESARELNLPVIIGVSEGERDFIGVRQAVALVKSLREEYNFPIFLNADHTHSLKNVEEAVKAGFDAVLFDGGKLPLDENIKMTKEAVSRAKALNPDILMEGEMGYIGASSKILKEVPKEAAIKEKDLTKPEDAKRFVKETGVDLLSPAVGNIHGMLVPHSSRAKSEGFAINPKLNIQRIEAIKKAAKIPLVLHGGSGVSDDDFRAAIKAGISAIHINTELRVAWRRGLEKSLEDKPEETTPYKVLPEAIDAIKEVVKNRLKLFNE